MKEFVEKLIERLEENIFVAELHGFGWDGQRVGNLLCLGDVKEIAEQLAEEHNNGWISVDDRLPNKEEYLKDDGRFIVTDGNRAYQSHYDIYNGMFVWSGFASVPQEDKCVIAWQPLPAPYKKGE